MNNRLLTRIILVLIIVVLTACTGGQPQEQATEEPKEAPTEAPPDTEEPEEPTAEALPDIGPIQIGYLPNNGTTPFYVAVEKGYFAEQGIEVEMTTFRSGDTMVPPLTLGELDVGSGSTGTPMYSAIDKGLDVRVVSGMSSMQEGYGSFPLIVRKDLVDSGEVSSVADLEGKIVALNSERGLTEYILAKALEHANLTVDDVEVVLLPFPEMTQAMANDAVDFALIPFPLASKTIQPGENDEPPIGVILIEGDKITDSPNMSNIFYGQRLLEPENKEIAVRIMMALLNATRDIQGDGWRSDDEVVNAVIKYTNLPEGAVRNAITSFWDPNFMFSPLSMADQQTYYFNRGYTDYEELLPLDQVVEGSFLEEAIARLGEYQE